LPPPELPIEPPLASMSTAWPSTSASASPAPPLRASTIDPATVRSEMFSVVQTVCTFMSPATSSR
jgi:hypothetical protein